MLIMAPFDNMLSTSVFSATYTHFYSDTEVETKNRHYTLINTNTIQKMNTFPPRNDL